MSWVGLSLICQLLEGWKLQRSVGAVLSPQWTIHWVYGAEWGWQGFLLWLNNVMPDMCWMITFLFSVSQIPHICTSAVSVGFGAAGVGPREKFRWWCLNLSWKTSELFTAHTCKIKYFFSCSYHSFFFSIFSAEVEFLQKRSIHFFMLKGFKKDI